MSVSLDNASRTVAGLDKPLAHGALSLRANFSWMFIANVLYAGCQWGILAVLAKLGTPAMVGQFVLALAITAPVMAFFTMRLRVVQATDAKREYRFGDYVALRLITMALALVTIAGMSIAIGYRREVVLVITVVAVWSAINWTSDIYYGLLQQRERMDRIAQSMIVKGSLSLAAFAGAILATGQLLFGILAMTISRFLVLVFWDVPNAAHVLHGDRPNGTGDRSDLAPRWDAGKMFSLARLSLPLGIVMMLIALSTSIPRYFVERHLGEHSLGIFGALAYLGVVGTTAIGALGQSASPRLAKYFAQGRTRAYGILLLKLAGIGTVVGIAGVALVLLAGPQILTIFYGPEYAEHSGILVWTMIAAAIGYVASFGGYGITAARYFRVQMPLFALVAAITAGACLWLVPDYGLMGAALSLCAAALAQAFGVWLIIFLAIRTQNTMCPVLSGIDDRP